MGKDRRCKGWLRDAKEAGDAEEETGRAGDGNGRLGKAE